MNFNKFCPTKMEDRLKKIKIKKHKKTGSYFPVFKLLFAGFNPGVDFLFQ